MNFDQHIEERYQDWQDRQDQQPYSCRLPQHDWSMLELCMQSHISRFGLQGWLELQELVANMHPNAVVPDYLKSTDPKSRDEANGIFREF